MAAGSPTSVAANRIPPTAGAAVPLVGGARLPLAFISLGLTALVVAVMTTALHPALLELPFQHPQVIGLVHLWLPGFLLSVCIGAVYQLMPVVMGVSLQLDLRLAWVHLGLHTLGGPLLVTGFFRGEYLWVAAGGLLVFTGLALLSLGLLRTFRASRRRDAAAWCFPIAAIWLALTVTLGLLLALERGVAFLPLSLLDLLRVHAHLGLVGFFFSLLQGVTFQLIPMFTMGTLARPRLVWAGLLGTQAGLLCLLPGFAYQITGLQWCGATLLILAAAMSGRALLATLRTRRRRRLEPGLHAFVAGACSLAVAAVAGLILQFTPANWLGASSTTWLYGLFIIVGGLSLTVLGMLCKIIPFLVWMRTYGPWVGKRPVPTATTLGRPGLELLWLRLHIAALLLLGTGWLFTAPSLLTVGALSLAAGVAVLLGDFCIIGRHLFRPTFESSNP